MISITITGGMPSPRGPERANHFTYHRAHDVELHRAIDESEVEFIERAHVDATSRGSSFLIIGGRPRPAAHYEFADGAGDFE